MAKVATLFQPRWSAGLRTLVKQVELRPEEIGAIAASFPGLKGTIDAHPKQFADAQRAAREIGQAADPTMTARDRRLARIKAVEPEDAGRVLTRGNAVMQTIIAIGAIFGGFGLAFSPTILFKLEPKPPDWVFGVGVGWMFLCLVLNLFWMLFFPTYFTSRYMLRQTWSAFEYRPSPAVDLKNPDLFFVDIVPRINWGKQMMENASDIGFLELNAAKRELIFEGDREHYGSPPSRFSKSSMSFGASRCSTRVQSSPNLNHLVVVRAMTADGAWETWFSRRQNTFKMRTANQRLADAVELESGYANSYNRRVERGVLELESSCANRSVVNRESSEALLAALPLHVIKHNRLIARVVDTMDRVGRGVHHRAGPDLGRLAVAKNLAMAALDDHDLFLGMRVGACGDLPAGRVNRPVTNLFDAGVSPAMYTPFLPTVSPLSDKSSSRLDRG